MSGMIMGVIEGAKNHIPIIYSPMTINPPELLNYVKYLNKIQKLFDPDSDMDSITGSVFGMLRAIDDIDDLEKAGDEETVA